MREIKFRGLDGKNNFIYGYYYFCDWKEHKHWIRSQKDSHFMDIAVKPETVGQYIGKNENGQEIYEGDIDCQDNEPVIIVWCEDECCFGLRYPDKKYIDTSISWSYVEVSGNIHENPELLISLDKQ